MCALCNLVRLSLDQLEISLRTNFHVTVLHTVENHLSGDSLTFVVLADTSSCADGVPLASLNCTVCNVLLVNGLRDSILDDNKFETKTSGIRAGNKVEFGPLWLAVSRELAGALSGATLDSPFKHLASST